MSRKRWPLFLAFALLCGVLQASCKYGAESFSWRLWGYEKHYFTVDDEEYMMRLDTSGFGTYEVDLQDGMICIAKDHEPILEGGFLTQEEYTAFVAGVLSSEEHQILECTPEDASSFLLYRNPREEGTEYNFLAPVEGSGYCIIFSTLPGADFSEEVAVDYAHRVQFSRVN